MCWRRLCTRVDVQSAASPIQLSRVFFAFNNTADRRCREVAGGGNAHLQHQHKLFHRLLRGMRETTLCRTASVHVGVDAAIPLDEPLATNVTLMEQLGVMDLARRHTAPFTAPNTASSESVMSASRAANFTEACRAGVKCQLPPIVVLRKVVATIRSGDEGSTTRKESLWHVPPAAASLLYRAATARLLAMTVRCSDELRRSTRRPQRRWLLAEEVRSACELLSVLDPREGDGEQQQRQQQQGQHRRDALRERLQLAAVVQNGAVAMDALERLLAFHTNNSNDHSNTSSNHVSSGRAVNGSVGYFSLAQEFAFAISAFRLTRDFASAVVLWERFVAIASQKKSVGNIKGRSDESDVEAADFAAEELRVLTSLADCIDANVAHFTYVQDIVLHLFTATDVGYYATTRELSQKAFCALLHALSRVTLESRARMNAAQSFFRAVQLASHADITISPNVTEALLQVACAARDGNTAWLLYNQLSAPNVSRAEVPTNMIAVLLAEEDSLNDLERYISFVSMRRRAIVSSAAHLLAVKLLLQQRQQPHRHGIISDAVYTVLDLIDTQHEVEPQRTFFLRLLVLHSDLHRLLQLQQQRQKHEDDKVLEGIKSDPRWAEYAQSILESWREELHKTGVTTAACTTLHLLQCIRQQFMEFETVSPEEREGTRMTGLARAGQGEGFTLLITCIDTILFEFSLGWLQHRASAKRTPQFHLTVAELQRRMMRDDGADAPLKVFCSATLGLTDVTKLDPAECRQVVLETFNALRAAASEGNVVVLGFSDYVRLCLLEDTGMMCTNGTTSVMVPASVSRACFGLDSMNSCEPLLYVTDALGELQLQRALHKESGVACIKSIDTSKIDSLMSERCHDICNVGTSSTVVGKWLTQWLTESFVFQPVVRGVFERHVELLLRTVPLSAASVGDEGRDEPMVTAPVVDEASTVLQWFVSVG